jgi:DNA-binding response OmpR family regulator
MATHLNMLVVDDEPELRQALLNQFTEEGFAVDTAEDGDVALGKIGKNRYDIVLLDLNMPRMNGMTVLTEMKKLNKYPHVVVLTIVDDLAKARECVRLGASDYLSKPYDPEELLHVVIKVLSS